MDRIDELRIFVRIIEDGGVSAAAERLNLSKSVVSRRLRALEERLGTELLARTTRSQRLTRAGELFYERCVQILADLSEAETAVTHSGSTLTGTLRITAPLYLGQHRFIQIIDEFLTRHKDLTIDLDLNDGYANLVEEGFDLAIRIGALPDSSLRVRKLMSIPLITCASPAYLEQNGRPETPADLVHHQGLMHRSGTVISDWVYQRDGQGRGRGPARAKINIRFISNNDSVLLMMAEQGHGIICMPSLIVEQLLVRGRLEEVLPGVNWQGVDVQIVYPPLRHISNRARSFIDFLSASMI